MFIYLPFFIHTNIHIQQLCRLGKIQTVFKEIHFILDFDNMQHNGQVYWFLVDFLKPNGCHLSSKSYNQGDVVLFRVKDLSYVNVIING